MWFVADHSTDGMTHEFHYGAAGRLTATALPDGREVGVEYGAESDAWAAVSLAGEELARVGRDAAGREVARQAGAVRQVQEFDPQGRLVRQAGATARGAAVIARRYGYDAADQIIRLEDQARGARTYEYDACERLLAVGGSAPERFVVDPAGNILARDVVGSGALAGDAAPGDRLARYRDGAEERTFTYDAWGNRAAERRAGKGGVAEGAYLYDTNNVLREVRTTERDRTGLARFGYDALGRRVWKATAWQVAGPAAPELPDNAWRRTAFVWSGDLLAAESDRPEDDPLATVYAYEPDSFTPLALAKREGAAGAVYRYHVDHLGTPQELSDAAGAVAWRATQQAWGAVARAGGGRVAQPLRFQGQYADAETGLHYNRHRYYSPAEGRFVNQDPIRLAGGENISAYTPNPVQWLDPLGLACTFDPNASRWRDTDTGRFRTRPADPLEMVQGGSVKHGDVQAWANQRSLPNQWTDPHNNFPSGGFKYRTTEGGYDYQVHGHGAGTTAPAGSNSASGPTARISRRPAGGPFSSQQSGLQSGGYGSYVGNENAAHIPLTGSPY